MPVAELVRIPLKQIRPNPRNPRRIIREDMVEARAASMSATGQATPIKVRPLTPEELAQEPDKEIRYEIVGGEIRYRGALKAGLTEIDALVRPISAQEALKEAIQDNIGFEPTWFETFLAMEDLKAIDRDIHNLTIANVFETDEGQVSRALKLMPLLNQTSRELILGIAKKPEGTWQFNERSTCQLANLNDQEAVEKALQVVLEKQMTEAQVKGLVAHIQLGGDPAQFVPTDKPQKGKASAPRSQTEGLGLIAPIPQEQRIGGGNQPEDYNPKAKTTPVEQPHNQGQDQAPHKPLRIHDLIAQKGKEALTALNSGQNAATEDGGDGKPSSGVQPQAASSNSPSQGTAMKGAEGAVLVFLGVLVQFAKGVAKFLWHSYLKHGHHYCKFLANQVVPISTHSSHSSSHNSQSLGPLARNPIGFTVHWGIYLILLAVFYIVTLGAVGVLIPPLKPWSGTLFHLLLVQMPLWVLFQALHTPWLAVVLGVGLLWLVSKLFQPGFFGMVLLAALLVVAYHFQGYWIGYVHEPVMANGERPKGVETAAPKPSSDDASGILASVPRSQTEAHDLSAPIPEQGIGVQVPEELKGRVANDAGIAMAFAVNFYGVSYDTPSTQLKYLDDFTNDHYTDAFFKEFYPKEKLREIRSQKLTLYFQPSKPAKVLKVDKESGEYLVEGVATTISEKNDKKQFISERPVGLIIDFDDRPSANGGIVKVTEVNGAMEH